MFRFTAASRTALRRWAIGLIALLVLLLLAALELKQADPPEQAAWRPTFMAALHGPLDSDGGPYDDRSLRFADASLRHFVPLELPGNTFRVRLSNQFGDAPLEIGAAQLAWRSSPGSAAIQPDSARELLFKGRPTVQIEKGQMVTSDPVEMPAVARRADLAVSLYLPQPTPRASWHLVGSRSGYRSTPGNHVGAITMPSSTQDRSLHFLAGIEVRVAADTALWVAFGDSITDGYGQSIDKDASWPAQVSQRWRTARADAPSAMLNAGISGGRLLSDDVGPSGVQRFARDVLAVDGVGGVVILIGINDLAETVEGEKMPGTVQALIEAQTDLAARARARGLKVVGATFIPAQGGAHGRAEVEAARQQFNRWIRSAKVFDAVVDLDESIRDPSQPHRMRADLTGDGLHPNDAGYRVIADAVVQVLAAAGLQR